MKKPYWLAIITLVGCDDPVSVDLVEAVAPIEGLHLSAVVTPSTFLADQMTQVTVTLRNEGSHTWFLPYKLCRDAFEISSQNAEVVRSPQPLLCTLEAGPPKQLDPSGQFEYKGAWRGGTSPGGQLSPGIYVMGGNVYAYRDMSWQRGRRSLNLRGGGTSFQIMN